MSRLDRAWFGSRQRPLEPGLDLLGGVHSDSGLSTQFHDRPLAQQGADAAAYSQKINMDNQYRGQQAEMDFSLGQSQAQALAMRDDINARNLAAQRNFGAAAASGAQRYALNQMQMNNQSAAQRAYLDVLERSNPFFNQWLGLDELRSYGKYNR